MHLTPDVGRRPALPESGWDTGRAPGPHGVKPDTFSLKHASDGLICLQVYTHIQVMCNRTVTCIKQACAFLEREVPQFPCRPNRLPPRPDVQSYRAMENKAYYACSCLLHTPSVCSSHYLCLAVHRKCASAL